MATLLRCAARFASFTESRTVNFVRHETPLIVNTSRAFSCTVRNLSGSKTYLISQYCFAGFDQKCVDLERSSVV